MMLSLTFLLKTSLFVLSLLNFLSLLLVLFLPRRVRVSAVPNKSAIPSTFIQPRLTALALLHFFLLRLSLLRGPGLGWIVCSFQSIQASTARLLLCLGLERPLPVVCLRRCRERLVSCLSVSKKGVRRLVLSFPPVRSFRPVGCLVATPGSALPLVPRGGLPNAQVTFLEQRNYCSYFLRVILFIRSALKHLLNHFNHSAFPLLVC